MQTDALLGLIAFCAIIIPALWYFTMRSLTSLKQLALKWWLILYVIAFIAQPLFLLRKHLEGAFVLADPSSLPRQLLAQVDNAWWEELAKLLALLIIIWIARDHIRPFFKKLSSSINLGFWVGLAYGAGEAVVLGILFAAPSLGSIFGLHTFTPFTIGWSFVLERILAMQIHAIMGALIGIGLWAWYQDRRGSFVVWFIIAMIYHDFVDGQIILAPFIPDLAKVLNQLGVALLLIDVAVGYLGVILAQRLLGRSRAAPHISTPAQ